MKKRSVYAVTAALSLTMAGALPFSSLAAFYTYQSGGRNLNLYCSDSPRSQCPENQLLGIQIPNTQCPESLLPGIQIPGNQCPDTQLPDTQLPDTQLPDIQLPDTQLPGNPGEDSGNDSDSDAHDEKAAQVLSLVNEERSRAGLSPLTGNSKAAAAAAVRAKEIQASFSHTRPGGNSFSTALTEAGISFRSSGENIAYGQKNADQVMSGWMNSSGHRANILNPDYTQIGIAHVQDASGTDYWVQLFFN